MFGGPMTRFQKCILLTIFGLALNACEDKSETNLYRAQQCINTATSDNVNTCLNFISTQNSPRAYVLRCSAAFISQGIQEESIVQAVEDIDKRDGGNPTAPALAALSMSNTTAAQTAVDMCRRSESLSLLAIANFSSLATSMGSLLAFTPGTSAEDIQNLIDTYDDSLKTDEEKAPLGQAVIDSQDSLCNPKDGLFKGTKACEDIDQAVSSNPGNAVAVADALLSNMKD